MTAPDAPLMPPSTPVLTPAEVLASWVADPVQFAVDNFGIKPDRWQEKAMRAAAARVGQVPIPGASEDTIAGQPQRSSIHRISLRACAGPGKSAVLAWVAWWFLATQGQLGQHPKGVCLGASKENLRDNLWAEMHKWRQRSKFLTARFDINAERAFSKEFPATWWLSARAYAQKSTPEEIGNTLSGLHSEFCAVFLDESGAMDPIILNRAEQAMATASEYGLIIQAGNPLGRDGCLFAAEGNADWIKIRITGDPDDPDRSSRVSIETSRKAIAEHGREDAWVKAFILGEFPDTALSGLLSEADVEAAMNRVVREDMAWECRIGIDVARYGDDRTVLFARRGKVAYAPVIMRHADGPAIAARYMLAQGRIGSTLDTIDDTGGYGGSTLDYAKLAGAPLIGIAMSSRPDDPRFLNKRAEMYWRAAEWVRAGGSLPRVDGLKEEAVASSYKVNNTGKLQVEDKDMIKRRLGRSPDLWDAFVMTFAFAERGPMTTTTEPQRYKTQVIDDTDPLRGMDSESVPVPRGMDEYAAYMRSRA